MLWLSISGDGTRLASDFMDSQSGIIIPDYDGSGGGTILVGDRREDTGVYPHGCWTTITPDTTYRVAVFNGPHRGWQVRDEPDGTTRLVDLHSAPGIDSWEVYHPKHSNHPRFITMTGPYSRGVMGDNNIGAVGPQVESTSASWTRASPR